MELTLEREELVDLTSGQRSRSLTIKLQTCYEAEDDNLKRTSNLPVYFSSIFKMF